MAWEVSDTNTEEQSGVLILGETAVASFKVEDTSGFYLKNGTL
jgi:hypothetical protein